MFDFKKSARFGLVLLALALLLAVNVALFTGRLLGLSPEVEEAMVDGPDVTVDWQRRDGQLILSPADSTRSPAIGLILFPEGNMDIRTYAPIGRRLAGSGVLVVLLSRRLARDYDPDEEFARVEDARASYPEISSWVVGGHTWGGRIAADYALAHPEHLAGVVLWAGRLGDTPGLAGTSLPVLMVYGTLDDDNVDLVAQATPLLPPQTSWVAIPGGNRVQFGCYGPMAADVGATISAQEQQSLAATATSSFLLGLHR